MWTASPFSLVRRVSGRQYLVNLLYGTVDQLDGFGADVSLRSLACSLPPDLAEALYGRHHLQRYPREQELAYLDLLNTYASIEDVPWLLYIPITLMCNLRCDYCFQAKRERSLEGLDEDRFSRIFRYIESLKREVEAKRGSFNGVIVLYGGEPLLQPHYPYVERVLSFCERAEIRADIITNGTTLDQYVELLQAHRRVLSNVTVTMDGDRRAHDSHRVTACGEGTYDLVARNIRLLEDKGIPQQVRVNLTKEIALDLLGGKMAVPSSNSVIYRVTHDDCSLDCPYSVLLELLMKGACEVGQIADNPVSTFYELMRSAATGSRLPFPLFSYCRNDRIRLFSVDGTSVHCCNEVEAGRTLADRYDGDNGHVAIDTFKPTVACACRSCPVLPVCGGGCPARAKPIGGHATCPIYRDIVGMIDLYLDWRAHGGEFN